jgi:putative endonuclease
MSFYTYLMASRRNGTLYAGSTDDLAKRYDEHVHKAFQGFTAKYDVNRLVWFECHESRNEALRRERSITEWRRTWKIELIEEINPTWRDLGVEFERMSPYELWEGLSVQIVPEPPERLEIPDQPSDG